jgi:hypothetical protein
MALLQQQQQQLAGQMPGSPNPSHFIGPSLAASSFALARASRPTTSGTAGDAGTGTLTPHGTAELVPHTSAPTPANTPVPARTVTAPVAVQQSVTRGDTSGTSASGGEDLGRAASFSSGRPHAVVLDMSRVGSSTGRPGTTAMRGLSTRSAQILPMSPSRRFPGAEWATAAAVAGAGSGGHVVTPHHTEILSRMSLGRSSRGFTSGGRMKTTALPPELIPTGSGGSGSGREFIPAAAAAAGLPSTISEFLSRASTALFKQC